MDRLRDMATSVREVANFRLFEISGNPVTIGTLITALAILAATVILSKLVQRAIRRALRARGGASESTVGTLCTIANYSMLIIGTAVALETSGIRLASLFAAGALFAVGIGLAMQNVVQSFVSGVILASERSIKPGDVLEVEGKLVKVVRLGIRATIVQTRFEYDLIVPNSVLVQGAVMNYTLHNSQMRLDAKVGVHYGSDMARVREVLEHCGRTVPFRVKGREPVVVLEEFGDSSVSWACGVWIDDPWNQRVLRSQLYEAVWNALQDAGITIAFPQVDVHFDAELVSKIGSRAA